MSFSARDLDYFLEVARHGQLARAATSLTVTAAALSKAIRRLEDEMGLGLFERSGHGMTLTPFGVAFRERAQRMKSEHDEALRHAGDVRAGRAGLIRVGATLAVLDAVLSPALAALQPRRPGMHVRLEVASSDELIDWTRQGLLDVAVIPTYESMPHGLVHEDLLTDALVAVARVGHPVFARRRLTMGDLSKFPWVLPSVHSAARAKLDGVFRCAGATPPQGAIEVHFSASWSLPVLAATDLMGIVPVSVLALPQARGVKVIPVDALSIPRRISLFSRPNTYRSPLLEEFVQALKALAPAQRSSAARKG